MKFTYNWLKDFVAIKIPPKALADKLTMAGLEVTALEEKDGDFIFEVEITSNRPDWLSVIGIAREVAALTNSRFRAAYSVERRAYRQNLSAIRYPLNAKTLKIEIQNKNDCPFYSAKIIKGVKIGPSPDWLKARLELIGCRSVNNAVDITNYLLFTYGQPLHVFDLDKLNSQAIIVRRGRAGEKITTIDGQQRLFGPETLVIADTKSPLALAGIIGGKDTQVCQETKNILLEAACFNPLVVRRARQKLGLQSDSAYRFERGVDSSAIAAASLKAALLTEEICGGRLILAKSQGKIHPVKKIINLGAAACQRALGANIPSARVKQILNNLGFRVKPAAKGGLAVHVPAYRQDVNLEIDLIEEVSRIFGYVNIPASLPKFSPQIAGCGMNKFISSLKNILTGLGLDEAVTYSLAERGALEDFSGKKDDFVAIANPLSSEQELLRPTLVPGLLRSAAVNFNQKQPFVSIFEIAKVFRQSQKGPEEEWALGLCLGGSRPILLEQGLVKDPAGFLHLKGILEVIFARLGIRNHSFCPRDDSDALNILCAKEKIGAMFKPRKSFLEKIDIKNSGCFAAEISLEKLFLFVDLAKHFVPLPLYPGISRDISIIIKEGVSSGELVKAIREALPEPLEEVAVTDYYKGKQIPAGFKGLTISCFYRSDKRTLTEAEINPLHFRAAKLLTGKFFAQLR